jgi:hypothetical protein
MTKRRHRRLSTISVRKYFYRTPAKQLPGGRGTTPIWQAPRVHSSPGRRPVSRKILWRLSEAHITDILIMSHAATSGSHQPRSVPRYWGRLTWRQFVAILREEGNIRPDVIINGETRVTAPATAASHCVLFSGVNPGIERTPQKGIPHDLTRPLPKWPACS